MCMHNIGASVVCECALISAFACVCSLLPVCVCGVCVTVFLCSYVLLHQNLVGVLSAFLFVSALSFFKSNSVIDVIVNTKAKLLNSIHFLRIHK